MLMLIDRQVEEELNPLTSLKRATVFMESLVFHQINPDKSSISLAEHTLRSVANRTPEKLTLAQHASLARLLMVSCPRVGLFFIYRLRVCTVRGTDLVCGVRRRPNRAQA